MPTNDLLQDKVSEIVPITIEDEMKRAYLDYAMSVIVSRALPDVRDGLKPVHRRILYSMNEEGFHSNKPFRKSARAVAGTMGNYHPHGNAAIYDAMVRLAQDFSMRLPLIDGQGNFGSMDGDPPAAERYTEARLAKSAHDLLQDIDKETVEFRPNYDNSSVEPVVLPAKYPNLLVNGAGGIAVGMATNIPPHNLCEVIDGCCALVDNPEITLDEMLQYIPAPDFPTGGIILGRGGSYEAYRTGRGSILMRARTHFEEVRKDRNAIIVTEVPYQVNKARLMERIAEVVQEKIVEGISDLRDESNRLGVRMVIELKRDAVPDVVLNQLFRHTPLQTSFGANMLAIHEGRPEQMGLLQILRAFLEFRENVIVRRTRFELKKARDRAHILLGLGVAVANIDEVIALIRSAPDAQTARERLLEKAWPCTQIASLIALVEDGKEQDSLEVYKLTEEQAKAILDLRLHRLTGLERDKISDELNSVTDQITEYLAILSSRARILEILKQELIQVKEEFGNPRRTTIEEGEFSHDMESLIQKEDMVVAVTLGGYIKRVPLSTYRAQKRGGKGRSGMATKEEDVVTEIFVANTHTPVLFFSTLGKAYQLKVYKLPLGSPQSRGKALINMLPLEQGETISTIMALPEDESTWHNLHIMFVTSKGQVRRNALSDFLNIRANGKIAMKLEDDDEKLIAVKSCADDQDVLLATKNGKCIRFAVDEIRQFMSRTSTGVRGIRLLGQDEIVSMSILRSVDVTTEEREAYLKQSRRGEDEGDNSTFVPTLAPERFTELAALEEFILTVSERGFGKRSSSYEYRVMGRGGQGYTNIETEGRNGQVAASFAVENQDDVILMTDGGTIIRCPVHDIRIAGRRTQGVTIVRTQEDERVVSVTRILDDGETGEEEALEEGSVGTEGEEA